MASWCPVVGSHFRRHFVKMKQVLNFKALFSFNCRMPTEEFRWHTLTSWKNEKVGSLQLHRCRTRNSLFPADAVWRARWTERGSICWGCHQSSQPDTQILALTDLMWFHRFRNVYDGLRLIGLIWSYRSDLSLAFSWKSWTILLPDWCCAAGWCDPNGKNSSRNCKVRKIAKAARPDFPYSLIFNVLTFKRSTTLIWQANNH